jgi:GT2 family glycosyltransferase
MLDLSIIIVNWNAKDLLLRCLEAVNRNLGTIQSEVIVVDNGSTDGSVEAACERFPHTRFLENQTNIGFSRANNQAIEASGGRYYLLLNTDTFLHTGALETMLRFMDANPDTGAAGCRLYYEDGSLQRSCTSFPTLATELWQALWLDRLFPKSRVFGKYWMTYWDFNDSREVESIIGACMLLRREAIAEVGLLDESYFMYSEETDLCYRLKEKGWKVRFIPQASATHIWGGTSKRIQEETTFLRLYKSRTQFFRKHYGSAITLLYKAVLILGSVMRVVGGVIAFFFKKNQNTLKSARNYWYLLRSLHAF